MFHRKNNFTEDDINKIIQLHCDGMYHKDIAKIFDTSRNSIDRVIQNTDLQSRHPLLTPEREQEMIRLYNDCGNMTEVGRKLHANQSTVKTVLVKHGIDIIPQGQVRRKHSVNSNYFDKIDDQNKAYTLGFLYADGNISKPPKHILQMSLQEQDKYIMEKMLENMNATNPLYFVPYKHIKETYKDQYEMSINDQGLWDGLLSHGMVPNKSLVAEYPINMESCYDRHFIRGLMDGDGCIQKKGGNVSIVCTKMILEKIKNIIEDALHIECKIKDLPKDKYKDVTKNLVITKKKDVKIFLDWIYKDAEMFLVRKHDIYINSFYAMC